MTRNILSQESVGSLGLQGKSITKGNERHFTICKSAKMTEKKVLKSG